MGCFLGCFGGEKDKKRRKQRVNRGSPQRQRSRVQNVQQENKITAEQPVKETIPTDLVPELRTKPEVLELETRPEVVEQPSPSPSPSRSPKKRVTFNSNITTYEHIPIQDSIDSLPEGAPNIEIEKHEDSKTSSQSRSISGDDNSVTSSVASYPPNHRYHNVRDSDDEAEEYGDSDLDELDDLDDEEDDYDEYNEDIDARISGQEVWSESVLTPSVESRTGNYSTQVISDEVESPMMPEGIEIKAFGSKTNTRDRSDYVNSVLNPVENITQWKAAKSKGKNQLKPQKENLTANLEPPRVLCSGDVPFSFKTKSDQLKNANQEIAVDASLSNWLGSPEIITPPKKTSFSGVETIKSGQTMSEGCNSVRSFEDRPILGALTVEELRQMSASNSPRKSPSRSPDDMPIIGTVGSYWNHSNSKKDSDSSSSFKGIPNTTSKYREDKRVNWHATPFETRLDRALNRGAAEA